MEALERIIGESLFHQTALLLLLATVLGLAAKLLRQPLIVMLIATGIIAGPSVLGLVRPGEQLELLAELGIAVLLFVVGLKLDVHLIRRMGKVALATGLGQVAFTSLIGFVIALSLGWGVLPAIYIAVALTFSSTIIIVKLLSDKREIDELHGRVAVGLLIVQDIVVVVVMIALTAWGAGAGMGAEGAVADAEGPFWLQIGMVGLRGIAFVGAIGLLMRWGLPQLVKWISGTPELMVLFAIAWGVVLASMAEMLGLSSEVGAFLGGVSLASTRYREAIAGRLVSVRDFLLLFFFVTLGAGLDLSLIRQQGPSAIVLSLFVLVGNPLIVLAIMGFMGYRRRTGFLTGLTVAQISEFSLILGAMGVALGHIGTDAMGLITLVGIITIGVSVYMIQYSQPLYVWLAPYLKVFERRRLHHLERHKERVQYPDVILLGLGRFGGRLALKLRSRGLSVLGVDFDPDRLDGFAKMGFPVVYGDAGDPAFAEALPLRGVRWVVGAVPDRSVNLVILHALREQGFAGQTAVPALEAGEADLFRQEGVSLVLEPYDDAAERLAEAIDADMHRGKAGAGD